MTAADRKLFPGQWFLERQDAPGATWKMLSRDNDDAVMKIRYEYTVENLKLGQSVRLLDPQGEIICQKTVDKPPKGLIVSK